MAPLHLPNMPFRKIQREEAKFDEIDYSHLDEKKYPKLPDLAEDVTGGKAWAPVAETTPTITKDSEEFREWWATAERAQAMKNQGKKVPLKDLFGSEHDPLECECGKPFYSDDDYMCPACREALDA